MIREIDCFDGIDKLLFGMRSLNLDQLESLAAVVELGSFSAAARRLALTQPAVSQQIRELELRYGVRLVERLGKRAYATEAGRALLEHQRRLAAEVEAALATLRRRREGWLGRVRFGTGAATLTYRLLPLIKELRQSHPRLELVASTGMAEDVVEALRENRLDLGLLTLPARSGGSSGGGLRTGGLVVETVLKEPLVAVLGRLDATLRRSLPKRPGPADLAAQPLLVESLRGGATQLVAGWFARAGVTLQPAMVLGSIEAVRNAVAAGLGVAVLPQIMTLAPHHADDIDARLLSPALSRTLALVYRPEKREDPAFRLVLETFRRVGG